MRQTAGPGYLEHLSDHDLELLARTASDMGTPGAGVEELRSRPPMVEELLGRPEAFAAVFGVHGSGEPLLRASPFLVFALAVHRCAQDLRGLSFVHEWVGPRQRVAVFNVEELRTFLADPARRLFLAELLASYTYVTSGSFLTPTPRGWRRRRFSELDPVRLASLVEAVPEEDRAGVYRRLGDLALFLTGVFPDHTATRAFGHLDAARLKRSVGALDERRDDATLVPAAVAPVTPVGLLERLGRRWYELAFELAPAPTTALRVVADVAERFTHARRVLNLVTEHHLFALRDRWFPPSGG